MREEANTVHPLAFLKEPAGWEDDNAISPLREKERVVDVDPGYIPDSVFRDIIPDVAPLQVLRDITNHPTAPALPPRPAIQIAHPLMGNLLL